MVLRLLQMALRSVDLVLGLSSGPLVEIQSNKMSFRGFTVAFGTQVVLWSVDLACQSILHICYNILQFLSSDPGNLRCVLYTYRQVKDAIHQLRSRPEFLEVLKLQLQPRGRAGAPAPPQVHPVLVSAQ